MFTVNVVSSSIPRNANLLLNIEHSEITKYSRVEFQVFTAASTNRNWVANLGGAASSIEINTAIVEVALSLDLGVYEIGYIRFVGSFDPSFSVEPQFVSGKDFPRLLFEVVDTVASVRSASLLKAAVEDTEAALERRFLSPVDIRPSDLDTAENYSALVFIRGLFFGSNLRLGNFEFLSPKKGLGSRDDLDFVNEFLRERTSIGVQFPYDATLNERSRHDRPVCVLHFPNLISSSVDNVRAYCLTQAEIILLALALSRGASGTPFEVVVVNRQSNKSFKCSISDSYNGNLVTGQFAGESDEELEIYLDGLAKDPTSRFLVGLYKQAMAERNPDFQYVRFWQILEIMAERRNYDPRSPLLDFEGNIIMDGSKPRLTKGSANIVFALLREARIGSMQETWKNVNVWFAFRSAVTHHGSIQKYSELERDYVREWAELGLRDIAASSGWDPFLSQLNHVVTCLLIFRLHRGSRISASPMVA